MVTSALFGLKRIFFDRIFERSYWIWRRHPAIIVPSMLATAISVIEQSIITVATIVLLTNLAANGLLPGFLSQLQLRGILGLFQNPSYGSALIITAIVSAVAFLAVAVIGGGFVYSSEFGVYLEAWNKDKVPISSIVENGIRNWRRMAWTLFLSNLITWGPLALAYVIILLLALNAITPAGVVALITSAYVLEFVLPASLLLALFTVYSYPAVVIDQSSGLTAIRKSFRTASHNLGVTVTYAFVRVLFQILLVLVVLLAGYIGLPLSSFSAAILSLLLTPIIHSTKTMIYYYAEPSVPEMPFELSNPIWYDISRRLPRAAWLKVKTGLSEAGKFVVSPRNLPFHLLSVLAFGLGIFLGNYVSVNGIADFFLKLGYQPGRANPLLRRVFPPVLGLDIFLNNWLVSIATALAGLGFGVPSFATILFNGFILGILVPLSPNTTMLLAAILPHGIIEIPSFILAGSIGIKLGYAAWKTKVARGAEASNYLSKTLRQTVYIVVGLAPLFLIAGLIEADITPIIMRMFGWIF